MNDPYLSHSVCVARLKQEWVKHGKLIIAYDFDNTVYDYHNHGTQYTLVSNLLRTCKDNARFIVFTAASKTRFGAIKNYLTSQNLPFDSINEDITGLGSPSKPYYNILLDDRAGLESAYAILKEAHYDLFGV
jgi:hypothetical protein